MGSKAFMMAPLLLAGLLALGYQGRIPAADSSFTAELYEDIPGPGWQTWSFDALRPSASWKSTGLAVMSVAGRISPADAGPPRPN